MSQKFIDRESFTKLLGELAQTADLFAPFREEGGLFYSLWDPERSADVVVGEVRAVQPLRSFVAPPREHVAGSPRATVDLPRAKRIVVGAAACDLRALEILKRIFQEGEFADPFFAQRLEDIWILSADCTVPLDVCFCNLVDGTPYPDGGFDLNVSPISDGYVCEAGSERAEKLLQDYSHLFVDVTDEHLAERSAARKAAIDHLEHQNRSFAIDRPYRDIMEGSEELSAWKSGEAAKCVECHQCILACPSCVCYLLYDIMDKKGLARMRVWDGCMFAAYWRVGGGATPKPKLYQRFQNRYACKFLYFPKRIDTYSCVGCGRCIIGCKGNIELRQVLKDVAQQSLQPQGASR